MKLTKQAQEAIEKTIEHLEKNPHRYNYRGGIVPWNNECSVCLLAWIGYFAGMPFNTLYWTVAEDILKMAELDFVIKIDEIAKKKRQKRDWREHTSLAVNNLKTFLQESREN